MLQFGIRTFALTLLLGLTALAAAPEGEVESAPILEQLPPGMEANLIDPLQVEKNPPFTRGEVLHFKLGWSIFTVASASLSVSPALYEDHPAYTIDLRTRTNAFADSFYKVRNHSISWIADDVSRSLEYRAIQYEGGRERDTQALFNAEDLSARYINHLRGDQEGPVAILPGTFDPLGIVFFIRSIDLKVGEDIVVPTSNGKEFFYTIIHVVKKVKRDFNIGRREAFVLEPDIKDIGGVFKRSPDGMIRFYFSADKERLPLRMESEVAVGKFWAELTEIGVPEQTAAPDPEESVTVAEVK